MKKLKAAWIGFMDYGYIRDGGDPFVYFEKYAKMGYKGWDSVLTWFPGDKEENYKRFKDLGLKCLSSWAPNMHDLVNKPDDIKRIAEECAYYDVDNVTIGNSSVISSFNAGYGNNGDYDSMMRDIEVMDKLVRLFGEEGITCVYHNHYQEFTGTRNRMSKRGSRLLRRVLFIAALANIRTKRNGEPCNPILMDFYKKKSQNKPKKVALGAVMHKLVYIIFAVLRDRKPFELRAPEDHARMLAAKNSAA